MKNLIILTIISISLLLIVDQTSADLRQDYFLDEVDDDDYNGEDLIEQGYRPLELMNRNQGMDAQQDDDGEMIEIDPSEFALNDETYENGYDDDADDMIVGPLKSGSRPSN